MEVFFGKEVILYITSIVISILLILDIKRMQAITSEINCNDCNINNNNINDDYLMRNFMKFVAILLLLIPVFNILLSACEWNDRRDIFNNYIKK
jgi:hypothetical protein